MDFLEELRNTKSDKAHTLDEVIELLQMMRDSTETNLKIITDGNLETYFKGKYEGLAVALTLVNSIKKG